MGNIVGCQMQPPFYRHMTTEHPDGSQPVAIMEFVDAPAMDANEFIRKGLPT